MAYGKPDTWPDGTPRNASPLGSGEALKDGRALRHADATEPPSGSFGFLDKNPGAQTNAQGTEYSRIDLRAGGPKQFTTADQKGGRKPR